MNRSSFLKFGIAIGSFLIAPSIVSEYPYVKSVERMLHTFRSYTFLPFKKKQHEKGTTFIDS
jgi:hypothetical protein